MEWIFDGIGTEIIGMIVSLIIGGFGAVVGYKIGIKRNVKQIQMASDAAKQKQELNAEASDSNKNFSKSQTNIKQVQKAGNDAVQTQIGRINDDCR